MTARSTAMLEPTLLHRVREIEAEWVAPALTGEPADADVWPEPQSISPDELRDEARMYERFALRRLISWRHSKYDVGRAEGYRFVAHRMRQQAARLEGVSVGDAPRGLFGWWNR